MIIETIAVIIGVAAVAGVVNLFGVGNKSGNKISFKETFDLLNAPIITFIYNGKKLHFLLDTGSSLSHIRPEVVDELGLKREESDAAGSVAANGMVNFDGKCSVPLEYKDEKYTADLMITRELGESLDILKRDFNLEVHGVLGCNFFNKYNYVVDFKEAVAYSKK